MVRISAGARLSTSTVCSRRALGTSIPPQAAIAHYLVHHNYERHLRGLRRSLLERVNQMSHALSDCFPAGTRLSRPSGGFVLWVQLPEPVDALKLFELAALHDIGIAPGPIFSACGGYRNFIRVNCSHPSSASLNKALRWLGRSVHEMCR
jgi:DNA-binding transcriptional MocR family regulator